MEKNYDKMLIELDKEKIIEDKKYSPEAIEKYITDIFKDLDIYQNEDGYFENGNFISFSSALMVFQNKKYITDYIKEWKWFYPKENVTYPIFDEDYECEDL